MHALNVTRVRKRHFPFVLGALVFFSATGLLHCLGAETLSIQEYSRKLEHIQTLLRSRTADANANANMDAMHRDAQSLNDVKILLRSGDTIEPDHSILTPLAKAKNETDVRRPAARLTVLITELHSDIEQPASNPAPPKNSDLALLERLSKEQQDERARSGGDVSTLPEINVEQIPMWEKIINLLTDFREWAGDKLKILIKWLGTAFKKSDSAPSEFLGPLTVTLILALAGLALLLALDIVRRNRAKKSTLTARAPLAASPHDADPLSRTANEWASYAAQLSSTGQNRMAIRAWYHAVLVALYRGGNLHYRKGRTNWEYYYSLAPELGWRRQFFDLTGGFEIEWYGREESTLDSLNQYAETAKAILENVNTKSKPILAREDLIK